MTSRRVAVLLSAAGIALGLTAAGCGGSNSNAEQPGTGGSRLGAPINLADCRDWNEGSLDERLGTIRELREFVGGSVAGTGSGRGVVLDDERAYEVFESYCGNEFARGFKLYKLYSRAAAFGGE